MKRDLYLMGVPNFANYESSAALIRVPADGGAIKYVVIGEDRLTRLKHPYHFPLRGIHYCLQAFGLERLEQVDYIFTDYARLPRWLNSGPAYRVLEHDYLKLKLNYPRERIIVVNHHDAHAAGAYYPSGYEEAAVVVVDGLGSDLSTQTLYHFRDNKILATERGYDWGIGRAYSMVTGNILPYGPEKGYGKVMGLAPYGEDVLEPTVRFTPYEEGMHTDYSNLFTRSPISRLLQQGLPHCDDREQVMEPIFRRAAYDIQRECERQMLRMAQYAYERTSCKNLCLSGGTVLNGVANWRILQETPFEQIFTPPNCSDTGISFGLALWGFYQVVGQPVHIRQVQISLPHAYTGRPYSRHEITSVLDRYGIAYRPSTPQYIAKKVAKGHIIAWFVGASETGPRALGHRSIIADPRDPTMKDRLNAEVKFREGYRPYAPSVLAEHADEYLDLRCQPSPFMLIVTDVLPEKRAVLPAITHVDGTARPQTVTHEANGEYYDLIHAFYQETGVPAVLNTSFNVNQEPIVETPLDALICALGTSINYLYLDGLLVECNHFRSPALLQQMQADRQASLDQEYQALTARYLVDYSPVERETFLAEANKIADWYRQYRAKYELEKAMLEWRQRKQRVLIVGTRRHTACLYLYIPEFPSIDAVGFVPMDEQWGERGDFSVYPEYTLETAPWGQVDMILISTHEYQRYATQNVRRVQPEKPIFEMYDSASDSLLYVLPGVWPVMNPVEARQHQLVLGRQRGVSTGAIEFDYKPNLPTIADRYALIVNYHYVHSQGAGVVKGLKGETPEAFATQLAALARRMPLATLRQLLDADAELPPLVGAITFDDGFSDVPRHALPILKALGLPATMFVCSSPYLEGRVLLVHKIQLLQAEMGIAELQAALQKHLPPLASLQLDDPVSLGIAQLYRYDDEAVRQFKTLVNYQLPYPVVEAALDRVFEEVLGSQAAWCSQIYASLDELCACAAQGIEIALHTHRHYVLSRLSPTEQRSEIETNMQFFQKALKQVIPVVAYPYGGVGTWGNETKRMLKDLGLEGGFTMMRRVVKPKDLNERWEIPRFDVRDIFSSQGELNHSVLNRIVVED